MNILHQAEADQLSGPRLTQILMEMQKSQVEMLEQMALMKATQEKITSAFPAADVDGHRRYHESVIEWRELRNRLVREALTKMVAAGTLAAAGWLVVAIWDALKVTVTR